MSISRLSILTVFALIASLFTSIGYTQETVKPFPQADFKSLKKTGRAEVANVISPYEIQLHDGRIIRLSGLEFPDMSVHESGDFSVTAVQVLEDMLLGQNVNIYQTKNRDLGRLNRLGHHIAHLEKDDGNAWVQGTLLSLGLARVRTTQRNPEAAAQMYNLEKEARKNNAGLWETNEYKVLNPETAEKHLDSLQIVEGKILSTTLKKNRIYLNFGKDWRSDFTISIAPKDKRLFSKASLDPLSWGGKTVRVRGWVRSYNGPYMEIDHPEAIETIN